MEATWPATPTGRIVPFGPVADRGPEPVRVDADRIVVERLELGDPGLAAWLAQQPAHDRIAIAERALKIGLLAIQGVGVSLNVDLVRAEFERLVEQTAVANERAAGALEQVLRTNFADGEGRLPRTMEAFLGDKGSLRKMVEELFDPARRDSAIGRIGRMLETYFDGDASHLARLLDPTRSGSPLHEFRREIADGFRAVGDRLVALEAAATARATERARSAAKGGDYEDLLEDLLASIARGAGDLLDRTSLEPGAVLKSKKGDFVVTVDPVLSRGTELRIVVEAKDRPMSMRAMREELREARENRCAAVALAVFTPAHAPAAIAPFAIVAGDVYCVVDPADPEPAVLEAAVRLARMLALAALDQREVELDAAAVSAALTGIREQLEAIKTLKSQLTSIGNATKAVWAGLDTLRAGVLARVAEAEAELRTAT
jgi:hypothetical protein